MRLPLTIWRYTVLELWRLIFFTASALVLVIAFVATIKPLADGKLSAGEAVRFMFLGIPPMLQYALPFAAGFGATLAYHGMASENELAAARAGGISHRSLLTPALFSGVVLAVFLSLLSGQVVPRFLRSMEAIIKQDLTRVMISTIDRGETIRMDDIEIYADRVDRLGPDAETGAYERLLLTRVVATEIGRDGAIETEVTAGRAWIWLQRADEAESEGASRVTIKLERGSWVKKGKVQGTGEDIWLSKEMPSAFRDDVKYLTDGEIRRLPANPDSLNVIDSRRRDLAYQIARVEVMESINAELRAQRRVRLVDGAGRSFVVRAARLEPGRGRWTLVPIEPGGRVEIEVLRAAGADLTRLSAARALLSSDIGRDAPSRRLALTLSLDGVTTQDIAALPEGDPVFNERESKDYSDLIPRVNPLPDLLKLTSAQLLVEADNRTARAPDEGTTNSADELRRRLSRLDKEILARKHERAAMAVSCLVMVMTGAVTAIRLKSSLPMPVYLWSFFPGVGAVISVNAGQELVRSQGWGGVPLLWGGIAVLAVYTAVVYVLIRRH